MNPLTVRFYTPIGPSTPPKKVIGYCKLRQLQLFLWKSYKLPHFKASKTAHNHDKEIIEELLMFRPIEAKIFFLDQGF